MNTRIIPQELLSRLNQLGSLALNAKELRIRAEQLVAEIIQVGRANEFTDYEIRELIQQEFRNKGLTGESTLRKYLPPELKRQNMVRIPKKIALRHSANSSLSNVDSVDHNEIALSQSANTVEVSPEHRDSPQQIEASSLTLAPTVEPESELREMVKGLEAQVGELKQRILNKNALIEELEAQVRESRSSKPAQVTSDFIKVRVMPKYFGRLYASLRNTAKFVELSVDASTLEVFDVEVKN